MAGYTVFSITGDPNSNAIVRMLFNANNIDSIVNIIREIISANDEHYDLNRCLVLSSMNVNNNYTFIGNVSIISGKQCEYGMFGGFIIQEISNIENWSEKQRLSFIENLYLCGN